MKLILWAWLLMLPFFTFSQTEKELIVYDFVKELINNTGGDIVQNQANNGYRLMIVEMPRTCSLEYIIDCVDSIVNQYDDTYLYIDWQYDVDAYCAVYNICGLYVIIKYHESVKFTIYYTPYTIECPYDIQEFTNIKPLNYE